MRHAGDFVQAEAIARLVAVRSPVLDAFGSPGDNFCLCRHLDHRHIDDRQRRVAIGAGQQEAVEDRSAVGHAECRVIGEIVADRAARRRRAHQRDLLHAIAGERTLAAFDQHTRLRDHVVGLAHRNVQRGITLGIERLQQVDVRRAVHDLDEHVTPRENRHARPFEDQRSAASMQRL